MIDYVAVALTIAGFALFFNAGEWESREGAPNRRVLWSMLSLLVSVLVLFVAHLGWVGWAIGPAGLFLGIAAVRVWLEERGKR